MKLLNIIGTRASEDYQDEMLESFIVATEQPGGSDLIYYPGNSEDGMSESIVKIVKVWCLPQACII
ncbi:TPA: bacteriocin immunity protein [Vibrio vulnificus]